jgi:hypothetical protein
MVMIWGPVSPMFHWYRSNLPAENTYSRQFADTLARRALALRLVGWTQLA